MITRFGSKLILLSLTLTTFHDHISIITVAKIWSCFFCYSYLNAVQTLHDLLTVQFVCAYYAYYWFLLCSRELTDAFCLDKNPNIWFWFFSDTVFWARSSNFSMVINAIVLYLFVPLLMTFTLFWGHGGVRKVKLYIEFCLKSSLSAGTWLLNA